jgi:hypothetical protein
MSLRQHGHCDKCEGIGYFICQCTILLLLNLLMTLVNWTDFILLRQVGGGMWWHSLLRHYYASRKIMGPIHAMIRKFFN